MINCREATRLISQSLDVNLPWHRRLVLKLHLLYCLWCRRYAAQLRFLRQAARRFPPEALADSTQKLTAEEKQQMCTRLRQKTPSDQ